RRAHDETSAPTRHNSPELSHEAAHRAATTATHEARASQEARANHEAAATHEARAAREVPLATANPRTAVHDASASSALQSAARHDDRMAESASALERVRRPRNNAPSPLPGEHEATHTASTREKAHDAPHGGGPVHEADHHAAPHAPHEKAGAE